MATPPPATIFYSCSSHGVDRLDGDDSDCFLSFEDESKDENDVGNIPSASNLQRWHPVSSHGSFKQKITSWRKCRKLGKGSFGVVYEVNTEDGSYFAVKEVSLSDQGHQAQRRLLQLEQDKKKLYVFLELMSKGSLSTLYRKRPLTESQVSAYTKQILEGLKYLHVQKVIHRDLKCANILVDASGSVKLADFGLAKATEMSAAKSLEGTFHWMAPEVLNSGKNGSYELKADIWSLGCTVLEMLTCKPPYSDTELWEVLKKIRKGEPPQVPQFLSEDARDFIHRCLRRNPKKRPSAAELLDHPFVRDPPTSGFA
ncbi:mitogen-activated protein kinase kinase kinase 9-like isoform X2 [Eucalyptus grandis]|uniref:mitogen-activated protein kinase kinase kinase 9-like isoform X2 n=1 Tax=Eucalyptus grandis TaxID=71139 RepID=UPI00192E9769|nr:mitogen-activated protein kinase kinase kinase 9-like isoform X2 [Eucalyptus grandis]